MEHGEKSPAQTKQYDGLFNTSPLTTKGRAIQLISMIGIPLLPSVTLIIYSIVYLHHFVGVYVNDVKLVRVLDVTTEAYEAMSVLQEELEQVAMYVGGNRAEVLGSLGIYYRRTNTHFQAMSRWPDNWEDIETPEQLLTVLEKHRVRDNISEAALANFDIMKEVDFYNAIIWRFVSWVADPLMSDLLSANPGVLAYSDFLQGMYHLDVEGTLSSLYFISGGFRSHVTYATYLNAFTLRTDFILSSITFNRQIGEWYLLKYLSDTTFTSAIAVYMELVKKNDISKPVIYDAVTCNRKYAYQTFIMHDILQRMEDSLSTMARNDRDHATKNIAFHVLVVGFLLVLVVPLVIHTAKMTTSNIWTYAYAMAMKEKDMRQEKRRTENVLNQMLPRVIAYRMRRGEKLEAEQFNMVTVYFSDIEDFAAISSASSPIQVVQFLNDLYNFMDSRIQQYDVYKVETIGCVYMVVSGLPSRNGKKHCIEIGRMSLDILRATKTFSIPHMPGKQLQMRIGIHSGPVVAGVVGNKMVRYCLFGDTVNTAARVQTNGLPRKIQLSQSTYDLMTEMGGFVMEPRGLVQMKGKGEIQTYWLLSRIDHASSTSSMGSSVGMESSTRSRGGSTKPTYMDMFKDYEDV